MEQIVTIWCYFIIALYSSDSYKMKLFYMYNVDTHILSLIYTFTDQVKKIALFKAPNFIHKYSSK